MKYTQQILHLLHSLKENHLLPSSAAQTIDTVVSLVKKQEEKSTASGTPQAQCNAIEVEVLPFDLSPIQKSKIRIEEDMMCDEEDQKEYLKEKERRRYLKRQFSPIRQASLEEQLGTSRKKEVRKLIRRRKKYDYLSWL